jgi:hypothetical protein
MIRASVAGLMLSLVPIAASAQTSLDGATPQPSQGPMIVERIHSGFLAAPDVRVTEVDKKTSELVGGYAGWVTDDTFFIGGGGYWLANQSREREMAYGGLVVQWLAHASSRVGFSAKGLVGGGRATLASPVSDLIARGDPRGRIEPVDPRRTVLTNTIVRFREDFFVAEPEVDVLVRLARHLRLTAGAGYRFTAGERGDDNRLRGAVGSVGLQIGGGS